MKNATQKSKKTDDNKNDKPQAVSLGLGRVRTAIKGGGGEAI